MDDAGRFSPSKLLSILSFFPASYVVIVNASDLNAPEILAIYLGAYVLGYLGGRGIDKIKPKEPKDGEQ